MRKSKDSSSSPLLRRCQASQPFVLLESVDDGAAWNVPRRSEMKIAFACFSDNLS
jgi:hypothetical protein